MRGITLNWFKDYSTNRTQATKIFNQTSKPLHINYGVPQGSVLGPILFLLYINDLPNIFTNTRTILFADDSTLYITGSDPADLIHTINIDLDNFDQWCLSNRLSVNLTKTFYMLFSNKMLKTLPPVIFQNNIIKKVTHHKLLGITLDDTLSFKTHISNLCIKLSRIISLLYQVKDFMPKHVLKILYYAHVLPHFLYCSPVWCNTYPTHLIPLSRLQKRIIRILTNSGFFDHTHQLFKEEGMLKLFDINKIQIALHMYKLVNTGNIPFHSLPHHNYPTRTRSNLRTPIHNLTLFQHSLSYSGPVIWNSIPDQIKLLPTSTSFKNQLKQHLLKQY